MIKRKILEDLLKGQYSEMESYIKESDNASERDSGLRNDILNISLITEKTIFGESVSMIALSAQIKNYNDTSLIDDYIIKNMAMNTRSSISEKYNQSEKYRLIKIDKIINVRNDHTEDVILKGEIAPFVNLRNAINEEAGNTLLYLG